jgi:hypothetical protein
MESKLPQVSQTRKLDFVLVIVVVMEIQPEASKLLQILSFFVDESPHFFVCPPDDTPHI